MKKHCRMTICEESEARSARRQGALYRSWLVIRLNGARGGRVRGSSSPSRDGLPRNIAIINALSRVRAGRQRRNLTARLTNSLGIASRAPTSPRQRFEK